MKIIITIFCLFIFSSVTLADGFTLNTSTQSRSFQLHTSAKNLNRLATLPVSLDQTNRHSEFSHIIPKTILASISSTTRNSSMVCGSRGCRLVSQVPSRIASSLQKARVSCSKARAETYTNQWSPRKSSIQGRR